MVVVEPGSFRSRNRAGTEAVAEIDRRSMAEVAERRYGKAMDAFAEFSRKTEAGAGDPERVAVVVERALSTDRPRPRYLVGADARMVVAMNRLLPTRVVDGLLSRTMDLPRHLPN